MGLHGFHTVDFLRQLMDNPVRLPLAHAMDAQDAQVVRADRLVHELHQAAQAQPVVHDLAAILRRRERIPVSAAAASEDISDLIEPLLDQLIQERYPDVLKEMKKKTEERVAAYHEWRKEKKAGTPQSEQGERKKGG
jgi:hypothetical protein